MLAAPYCPEAFAELYDRHAPGLFRYLRVRCNDTNDAFDIVAETFAEAYEQIDRFDADRGKPGAWLFGIARNQYRRFVRTGVIDRRAMERLGLESQTIDPDTAARLDHVIDLDASVARVRASVHQLPDRLAAAVELRYLREMSYRLISEHLGISEATARKRVSRGIELLSTVLGGDPTGIPG